MQQAVIPAYGAQRIRDPVHGLIAFDCPTNEVDRFAWALVNTREFQRLRRIKQLGFSELVYPGASHTRFAHSIGAYQIARKLLDIARWLGVRDEGRERAAALAALLHDIGHGPFSHAFEHVTRAAGHGRKHEHWSAAIISGDTEIRAILDRLDPALPDEIATMIKAEQLVDIFTTIVSSQFDADRLDYIQRDRIMSGVQFGHIDFDWLFDCLRIEPVRIREDAPGPEICFYLNHKGVKVAEEYLEARFRLYTNLYMHKTTRAAEKMLQAALTRFREMTRLEADATALEMEGPLARVLRAAEPSLPDYLALDDTSIWAALSACRSNRDAVLAELAARLLDRKLYKCFDLGPLLKPEAKFQYLDLYKRRLAERFPQDPGSIPNYLEDDDSVSGYKWYDFGDPRALKKVFVKRKQDRFPVDIGFREVSRIVETLKEHEAIHRFYARDKAGAERLEATWNEMQR